MEKMNILQGIHQKILSKQTKDLKMIITIQIPGGQIK
jgi:hypothetical protein